MSEHKHGETCPSRSGWASITEIKVNEAQNTQADRASSPLNAQVEGFDVSEATPRPWKRSCFLVQGPKGDWVAHTGMGNLPPSRSHESEANAALIVTAVNDYDSTKAEIVRLTEKHETLCRVLCRETETQTPVSAISEIRSTKAKVEKLEAALRSIIAAYDRSKLTSSAPSAISVIRTAVESARAALIESPTEVANGIK